MITLRAAAATTTAAVLFFWEMLAHQEQVSLQRLISLFQSLRDAPVSSCWSHLKFRIALSL